MGEPDGRAQREAVNVILRLLSSLRNDDINLARELLVRVRELDVTGVHSNLMVLVSNVIDSRADARSLQLLYDEIQGTPFESIFTHDSDVDN